MSKATTTIKNIVQSQKLGKWQTKSLSCSHKIYIVLFKICYCFAVVLCDTCFRSSRCVCVSSRGKGGCGGLWGCDCGPVGGGPDPEPRKTEGLLFGLLPWIWSWRTLWEWSGVGLLWELQPRHALHQRWGGRMEECCNGKKTNPLCCGVSGYPFPEQSLSINQANNSFIDTDSRH